MSEKWLPPIYWDGDAVAILDQRVLPHREKILLCTTPQQVITAIKNMAIRGAPAVGVAGALALALGARELQAADAQTFRRKFVRLCEQVKNARPTGNNLGWAVERVYSVLWWKTPARTFRSSRSSSGGRRTTSWPRMCGTIWPSGHGVRKCIPTGARVLTYCNAGALATADYGTAVGVIRAAFADDPTLEVYSCETRPFLQGARLTAYELMRAGIPVTLITDNAAGSLMQQGKIDVVVVGADRIAANGDTANKIGTYMVAVLARTHNIPFYMAAPRSTIDPSLADGSGIPIEQRDPREVTHLSADPSRPGISGSEPGLRCDTHKYITGIITEVGVLQKPFSSHPQGAGGVIQARDGLPKTRRPAPASFPQAFRGNDGGIRTARIPIDCFCLGRRFSRFAAIMRFPQLLKQQLHDILQRSHSDALDFQLRRQPFGVASGNEASRETELLGLQRPHAAVSHSPHLPRKTDLPPHHPLGRQGRSR